MHRARIVFLLQDLCIGGTQRQSLALAAGLDRARFAPELWTLSGPTDLDAEAEALALPLLRLGRKRFPSLSSLVALWQQLGRQRPDLLFLCTALPNIWGRIAGPARRLPLIVGSCRGGGAPRRQHERWLWPLTRHIVCNSQALREVMLGLGVPRTHLSYISNGVDCQRFVPGPSPLDRREALVLCVARLVEDKNHACLLEAFARVLESLPQARLCLVGEGPLEQEVRARMAHAPLAGRVELLPATSDILAACHRARVFALSSRQEGTPNVLLEAMACGLPVVASRVGGIPHLVRENSGLLVESNNAAELAAGLLRLLGDAELAQQLGQAGRLRVEQDFSFATMIAAHEELFTQLLQQTQE